MLFINLTSSVSIWLCRGLTAGFVVKKLLLSQAIRKMAGESTVPESVIASLKEEAGCFRAIYAADKLIKAQKIRADLKAVSFFAVNHAKPFGVI